MNDKHNLPDGSQVAININELWYPFRWGLKLRKLIYKMQLSYGQGFMMKIQRPFAVFTNSLFDFEHQEKFECTPARDFSKTYRVIAVAHQNAMNYNKQVKILIDKPLNNS